MIAIPWRTGKDEFIVALIFDQHNMDRMLAHDPAVFELSKLPPPWNTMKCKNIRCLFGSGDEIAKLIELGRDPKLLAEHLKHMERGWTFRPELGDGDQPFHDIMGQ